MDLVPVEREYPIHHAVENMKKWLTQNGIRSSIDAINHECIANVELTTLAGLPLATGSGKGIWAVAGAYFEAFEHMMLEHHFISSHSEVLSIESWLSSNQVPDQCIFAQALSEYPSELVKLIRYQSLYSSDSYLIPDILVNPFYHKPLKNSEASAFLKRYSSNSGWASGSSFKETVLHGANEVIERHYLSELYKQLIGYSECTGEFIRILPPRDLVKKYKPYLEAVSPLTVILSETKFGCYFCLCFQESRMSPMAMRAAGISYSKYHAIERAISELAQCMDRFDMGELRQDTATAKFLNSYEKLTPIAALTELCGLDSVDLSYLQPELRSFDEHFYNLVGSVRTQGYDLLTRTAFSQNNIWLTSTYIPGLERFNIIDKGISVTPLG